VEGTITRTALKIRRNSEREATPRNQRIESTRDHDADADYDRVSGVRTCEPSLRRVLYGAGVLDCDCHRRDFRLVY
jgi:hypothetical protein